MDKTAIQKIIDILQKEYDISGYSNRGNAYEVLVGTVLSQRTKDEVTWPRNKELMKKANTPEKMLELSEKEIAKIIYPVGFYNQKAKKIKELSRILVEKYGGKVPRGREELMRLPGVGGKTADCVLCFAFNEGVIPVDVHVEVIAKRLGIADWKDKPEVVRKKLHQFVPKDKRNSINALFVEHGKRVCTTRRAYCERCSVVKYCPKIMKK
ncbi:MAG: endonuclease III [Candidatus Aenigmarchaeota archaeon CG_4_10_14_0_8_um_filter_37_24]|nr:endonuclease III [Candidatus Aenigmarchaeota archaeon]OIN88277.1 MAG: hypothetical protein AUJ50_01315 [Candidatus Aenigmarchaeota archaeon CG1_02_38_14]PIV69408.1 MAG: endonuclease III [Candidatus Aenigmarchaeota archaeon CG01_land_8_20_14_3_00_37_9]PIW41722.1 MAG: endonuclease III [Candidatus Aenigmarchaeota archaeon CG15_BIG_FIL_POST_REV_8_21_14_020_37_27]PIX50866.1 MAG: endonuclease III [Candidatus Aenigmarchaeota archaeon CG_4_8_14_3_um_filter_37_24]PIY36240.1 MAG: endonuclease III [Ca